MLSNTSKKTVKFNPVVKGIRVLSIYDYTPKEIAACWYDEDQMIRITKRCYKLLKKMEIRDTKMYCIRGLEGHTTAGSIAKNKTRSAAIAAVLMEQSKQEVDAEHTIADAYGRRTFICQMRANVMGKRDRDVANAIFSEPTDSDSGNGTANNCRTAPYKNNAPQKSKKNKGLGCSMMPHSCRGSSPASIQNHHQFCQ